MVISVFDFFLYIYCYSNFKFNKVMNMLLIYYSCLNTSSYFYVSPNNSILLSDKRMKCIKSIDYYSELLKLLCLIWIHWVPLFHFNIWQNNWENLLFQLLNYMNYSKPIWKLQTKNIYFDYMFMLFNFENLLLSFMYYTQ